MQYDYLAVRDGDNENSTLIGRFCGDPSRIPDPFISSFNYLWFNFVTDGSVQNRGFKLNYTTQPSVCGGILSGSDHGIIRSPLSPDRYPHGETFSQPLLYLFISAPHCVWNSSSLSFSFLSLSLCLSSLSLSLCLFTSLCLLLLCLCISSLYLPVSISAHLSFSLSLSLSLRSLLLFVNYLPLCVSCFLCCFCLSLSILSVHSLSNSNYISLSLTLSFFFYIFNFLCLCLPVSLATSLSTFPVFLSLTDFLNY